MASIGISNVSTIDQVINDLEEALSDTMASAIPTFVEILACFLLSTALLNRYSDMVNNNIVTVVGVFMSWFFSFMVIFMLPNDLTSVAYRQCLIDYQNSINSTTTTTTTTTPTPTTNGSIVIASSPSTIPQHLAFAINMSLSDVSEILPSYQSNTTVNPCIVPWNHVPDTVLVKLWRFVYWTSQLLTWLILPIMQSYSMSGEFTTVKKLKSALRANLIYYSSIGAIFLVLLIYVILRTGLQFSNLKVIAISSSNTWGLILLVVLLGYGLVELPRFLINRSKHFQSLNRQYFKVGKLNAEKCEAEEKLDDALEEIHQVYSVIGNNEHSPLKTYLNKILDKCPPDWKRRSSAFRRQAAASNSSYEPDLTKLPDYDLQALIGLHRRVIKAVNYHRQIMCRWNHLIEKVIELEDVARNYLDNQGTLSPRLFKSTLPKRRSFWRTVYTPKVEWYWKCIVRVWIFRVISLVAAIFSAAVVWSEITFPLASFAPRLSIFAYFVDNFQATQQYFYLELFSTISIGYLAICAFYTVFHMKIFNVYYLASNKQTDEYSLTFSGMLVCKLTAPLCLNYLCLVNKDSRFIQSNSLMVETSFTTIMGHLDLIPIVNSGLNIFLPLCMSAICLSIYFNCGTKILHNLGYEQFIENDEMTEDLVKTGRELVEREKTKLLRNYEASTAAYHDMVSPNSTTPNVPISATASSSLDEP